MVIVGLIVELNETADPELADTLQKRPHVTVQKAGRRRITLVLDTDDIHVIAENTHEISEMKGVKGVFPIFSGSVF
jgi:nitrate reductase NapAB chaperone NapD